MSDLHTFPGPTLTTGLPYLSLLPADCIAEDPAYADVDPAFVHSTFWCPRHDSRVLTFACCGTTRVISSPAAAESARALHECEVAS